ncbi:DUF2141 domain-containing protein [Halocola ammonii]
MANVFFILTSFLFSFSNTATVEEKHTLEVTFTNIEDAADGKLLIAVYNTEETFLDEEKTYREAILEPKSEKITTTFKGLAPGRYAVAVINDQNGNEEMDLNMLNMPTEQYGFSNNPFLMGKPKWKDCSFELSQSMSITIEME